MRKIYIANKRVVKVNNAKKALRKLSLNTPSVHDISTCTGYPTAWIESLDKVCRAAKRGEVKAC